MLSLGAAVIPTEICRIHKLFFHAAYRPFLLPIACITRAAIALSIPTETATCCTEFPASCRGRSHPWWDPECGAENWETDVGKVVYWRCDRIGLVPRLGKPAPHRQQNTSLVSWLPI
jgi:hypothetical protein